MKDKSEAIETIGELFTTLLNGVVEKELGEGLPKFIVYGEGHNEEQTEEVYLKVNLDVTEEELEALSEEFVMTLLNWASSTMEALLEE